VHWFRSASASYRGGFDKDLISPRQTRYGGVTTFRGRGEHYSRLMRYGLSKAAESPKWIHFWALHLLLAELLFVELLFAELFFVEQGV